MSDMTLHHLPGNAHRRHAYPTEANKTAVVMPSSGTEAIVTRNSGLAEAGVSDATRNAIVSYITWSPTNSMSVLTAAIPAHVAATGCSRNCTISAAKKTLSKANATAKM